MESDAHSIQRNFPQYLCLKKLGSGSFATVYKVRDKNTNIECAIKKISLFGMGQYQKKGAINQAQLLASLNHKNVIKLHEWKYDSQQDLLFLRMQLAKDGDLINLINNCIQNQRKLEESQIWNLIEGLASGLSYIHANKIIHRDIKPANVFISEGRVKIADMNVSRVAEDGFANTRVGSPNYICPQIWSGFPYDHKCDSWSLGVLIFQLCQFRLPFDSYYFSELQRGLARQRYLNISRCYSRQLQNLINDLLRLNPTERIGSSFIQSAYFKADHKQNEQIKGKQSQESINLALMMDTDNQNSFRQQNNSTQRGINQHNPSIHLKLKCPYQSQQSLRNQEYYQQNSRANNQGPSHSFFHHNFAKNKIVGQSNQNSFHSHRPIPVINNHSRGKLVRNNLSPNQMGCPRSPNKILNQIKSSKNLPFLRQNKLSSSIYLKEQRRFKTITQNSNPNSSSSFANQRQGNKQNHFLMISQNHNQYYQNSPRHFGSQNKYNQINSRNQELPFQQLKHQVYLVTKQPQPTKTNRNHYQKLITHGNSPQSKFSPRNLIRSPFRSPYAHHEQEIVSPKKGIVNKSLGKKQNNFVGFDNLRRL